jgi:RHS repeat-associated protein
LRVLPGQYFDAETGLNYNYFRDYDPGIGRYIQSDLIGLRGGKNTYGYVFSSPLRRRDRLGLAVDFCDDWGTCYINQPAACLDDLSACNDWKDPGDPKASCFVTCGLHVVIEGAAEHVGLDVGESLAHKFKRPVSAACRTVVKSVFFIKDVIGVRQCHKECYECDGICPAPPQWNGPDNRDFPRLPPLPITRR